MAPSEAATTSITSFTDDYDYDGNYNYTDDYEDELCHKNSVMQFGFIFMPVFFSMVVVLSLVGNILVLVVLVKYENLKSLTNTFILNLALSDLLFTSSLPFWVYNHMYTWTIGELTCKIVSFNFYLGFYSSGILLILMTIHRYIAVVSPLSNIVTTTGFYSVVASVLIWLLSVLASSPAFVFATVKSGICCFLDSYWTLWAIYQQNVLFLLSAVVFILCYSQIMCRLLRPTAQRRRTKTVKLIFVLMAVFFVGWVPFNTVIFLQSFHYRPSVAVDSQTLAQTCEQSKRLDYALYVARFFAYSHCCLNPIFYVFVGIKFKNHLKKLLSTWRDNGNNSVRSRRSRLTITSVTSGEEFSL